MDNFMPHGKRRKYLGKARLRDSPYSCPKYEEMGESMYHFFRG